MPSSVKNVLHTLLPATISAPIYVERTHVSVMMGGWGDRSGVRDRGRTSDCAIKQEEHAIKALNYRHTHKTFRIFFKDGPSLTNKCKYNKTLKFKISKPST